MKIFYALLIIFGLFAPSIVAQPDDPITPKSGYWTVRTDDEIDCLDALSPTWSRFIQVDHQTRTPIRVSADENAVFVYGTLFRRYLAEDQPTTTFIDPIATYGKLTVHSSEHMTLETGIVSASCTNSDGHISLFKPTYRLDYSGDTPLLPQVGTFQAGYWTITSDEIPDRSSDCPAIHQNLRINAEGIPQYNNHLRLHQDADNSYHLALKGHGLITVTPQSDRHFTASYQSDDCLETLIGEFERDFLTDGAYDDLVVDASIILQSGIWDIQPTRHTLLNGSCEPRPISAYLYPVLFVNHDGSAIDMLAHFNRWSLTRDEQGLYHGGADRVAIHPSYLVIEAISTTSFHYYFEHTQDHAGEACIVLQTGVGTWVKDFLPAEIAPYTPETCPPLPINPTNLCLEAILTKSP